MNHFHACALEVSQTGVVGSPLQVRWAKAALDGHYRAGKHARRASARPEDGLAWEMRQLVCHLHAFVMDGLLQGAAHGFEQVLLAAKRGMSRHVTPAEELS